MEKKLKEKMKNARTGFGVSCVTMSKILGLGVNQWRNYEKGEQPNRSNENLIRIAVTPRGMQAILEKSPNLKNEKWFPKLYLKVQGMNFEIERAIQQQKNLANENYFN